MTRLGDLFHFGIIVRVIVALLLGSNCDFYHFKLEDLSKDIKPLSDLINLPLSPLYQINPNPIKVNYETHKTPQNKLIIQNLFSEDFDTFGYEK